MLKETARKDFLKIYDIMEKSFPEDERRSCKDQEALFDKKEYRMYSEWNDEGPAGFIAVWEFEEFAYIEHFAVKENFRNGGAGKAMLTELLQKTDKPVVLEVEPPIEEEAKRRIGFYERNGFCLNDHHYIQLPLGEGKNPVELKIMSYPEGLSREGFEKVRDTLYKFVFGVENR